MRNKIVRKHAIQEALRTKRAGIAGAESQIDLLQGQIEALEAELDELFDVVQVAYIKRAFTGSLRDRETWEYIDGTVGGLSVGDTVVAPTRYGDQIGVVVALTRKEYPYGGELQKITRVISGAP